MENTPKKKVCHVASADITVKFLLMPQLKFLVNEGYDVYAVCSDGKWVNDIRKEGIKVKTIRIKRKISPFSDLLTLWQMFWYFKYEKFDIVHTHTPKPALLGQLSARLAGVPIVINTIHGLYFGNKFSYFKKRFYIFIEKISDSFSDLIFSQNKEDVITMENKKIADKNKIKYLGNGINLEKFNRDRFSEEFIKNKRKELGIKQGAKVVGAVGRLVKEKGYFELFEAFKKVLKSFPDTILLVVGGKDLEKKDSFDFDAVKEFGIEKNVIFLGERAGVDEVYPLMDIFVLASHREGFPRTIIEAGSEKLPVVATDIRGCREIVENKKTGILVPLGNVEKLSEIIKFLLENPDFAKKLGENGRLKAEKEFNESLVFEKIKEEYRRLISKKLPTKQIKICHVTTVDITARFIIFDFLKFLKNKGYKVFMVCSFSKWEGLIKEQGVITKNIKMTRLITPIADLISFINLYLYFKKEKFDIVHTHTPKAGVLGRIAARLAGTKVVIHSSHGFYIGVKIPRFDRSLIMFGERVASHFCDLVFSLNREDTKWAIENNVVREDKIKFLNYGIDIKKFNPQKFSQEFIINKKKELGMENNKIIGMVGRLVKEKGYLDLFLAFKIVKQKIPDAVLLLVAPNDKEKEDALDLSILKEYGIEKETVILGYEQEISDIETIYPLMDVFVLPSYREGFPYSVMEASAFAKPVIATDIRGCREAVENGYSGRLVPVSCPEKLAEAIIYFLENSNEARRIGENGRKKAEKEFNEDIVFDKIEQEYIRLLKQKL